MEKTSRGEVLVTLSPSDQQAFGIAYAALSFSDYRIRRICEQLAVLVCLRQDSEGGNVTVRASESSTGELLLFFSLSDGGEDDVCSQVIEFPDLDSLLDSRSVFLRDRDLCVEVYRWNGKYYLWYETYLSCAGFDELTLNLLEFGALSPLDRSFLAEHATPLPAAVSLFLC